MVLAFKPKNTHTLCPTTPPLGIMPMAGLTDVFQDVWTKILQCCSYSKNLELNSSSLEGWLAKHWDTPVTNSMGHLIRIR